MPNAIETCGEGIYKTKLQFNRKGVVTTAHVAVHLSQGVDQAKIQDCVQKIALKEWKQKNLEPAQPLNRLNITSLSDTEIKYELNGIKGELRSDENRQTKKSVAVASCTHHHAVAIFQAKWSRGFERFISSCTDALLLLIYNITKALFGKPWVTKPLSPAEKMPLFDKMEKCFAAHQPEDYAHLMDVFANTLKSLDIPEKQREQLEALLTQGAKDGLHIQEARESGEINSLSDTLAKEVIQAFQAATAQMDGSQKILKLCDLGYLADGHYHPQPVAFIAVKDANNKFYLHIRFTDLKGTSKQVPFTEFKLPLEDDAFQQKAQNVIADLFKVMIPFGMQKGNAGAIKTIDFTNPKVFEITTKIVQRQSLGGQKGVKKEGDKEEVEYVPLDVTEMVTKAIHELGFVKTTLPKALEDMQVKCSGNWSKNLLTTLRAAVSDHPLTKSDVLNLECSFLMSYASNLSRFILETNPANEVRNQRLKQLDHAITQLEKKYAAEWGDQKAFEKMLSDDALPAGFKGLRKQLASLKTLELHERSKALESKSILSSTWNVELPLNHSKLTDTQKLQAAPTPPARLTFAPLLSSLEEKLELLAKASEADQKKLTQELLPLFAQWTEKTEELFKQGNWNDYLTLQGTFFNLLPPPPTQLQRSGSALFWMHLDAQECDKMSEQLTHLAHHYWESSLRLARTEERQEHAFAFVNLQLVQHALIRRYAQNLLEKNQQNAPRELYPKDHVQYDQLGLSNDEINTIAFAAKNYTGDLSQAKYILTSHPIFRGGHAPLAEIKRQQCLAYIEELNANNPQPFIQDSYRYAEEVPEFLIKRTSATEALNSYKYLQKSETERGQSKPNEGILPAMLIDLRRLNVFGQMLLHPESSMHISFRTGGVTGQLARVDWLVARFTKAAQNAELDDASIVTKAARDSLAEDVITLGKMGSPLRLVTHFTATEEVDAPCLVIKGSNAFSEQLEYEPTGVLVFDNRDPVHDFSNVGQQDTYPKDLLKAGVGVKDVPPNKSSGINESKDRPRQQETREPLTEMTAWILEHYDPSLPSFDMELNAKLRTLEIVDTIPGVPATYKNMRYISGIPESYHVSLTTLYNVFDILSHRADCLENETVQRILEMALYRTGLLQNMVATHTDYFLLNKIGERLHHSITSAIQNDQKITACFLLQVSQLIKQNALCQRNPANQREMLQLAQELPDFSTEFVRDKKSPDKKQSGRNIIQQWANTPDLDSQEKKYVDLSLLHSYCIQIENDKMEGASKEQALAKISISDYAQIVQSYHRMKLTSTDTGYPSMQRKVEEQFESIWLPFINDRILADKQHKNEFLTRLWYLHETNKADLPPSIPDWTSPSAYVWDNGNGIQLNLLNGVVSEKGVSKGFETSLPQSIFKNNPQLEKIIGKSVPVVEAYPLTGDGNIVDYIFQKQGRKFIIRHDSATKEVLVMQEIPYKGKLHLAHYILPKGQFKGHGALIDRYGIWLDVNKPTHGFLVLHPDQNISNPHHIAEVTLQKVDDKTLEVTEIHDQNDLSFVQDVKGELQKLFGFADCCDTVVKKSGNIFTSAISEIQFLSKNLTLRKENGAWITDGQLKGYAVQPAHPYATQEFGYDFHQFALPVCKVHETTEVQETKFLIWPHKLLEATKVKPLQADTKAQSVEKMPLLTIQLRTGVTSKDDQHVQGTGSGFMYIAYALMKQKQYDKALVYLNKAQEASLPQEEAEIFRQICTYFQEDGDTSKKALALKLKAEAISMQIWKVQIGKHEYTSAEWMKHMERVKRRIDIYEQYKKRVEADQALSTRLDPMFYLSKDEKTLFEHASLESIKCLLWNAKESKKIALEAGALDRGFRGQISRSAAKEKAVEMLFPYFLKPANKKPLEELRATTVLKTWFLKNYTAMYQELIDGTYLPDDYRIIRLKSLIFAGATKEEQASLDLLRHILLRMSLAFKEKKNVPAELKDIKRDLAITPEIYNRVLKGIEQQHVKPGTIKLMIALLTKPFVIGTLRRAGFEKTSEYVQRGLEFFGIYHPQDVDDLMSRARNEVHNIQNSPYANIEYLFAITADQIADPNEESVGPSDTSIEHIEKQIDDPHSPLSAEERNVWRQGVEFMKNQAQGEGATPKEKIDMMLILQTALKYNIHIIDNRHQTGKIRALQSAKKATPPVANYAPIALDKEAKEFEKDQKWIESLSQQFFALDYAKPSYMQTQLWMVTISAQDFDAFNKQAAEVKDPQKAQDVLKNAKDPAKWYLNAIREISEAKKNVPDLKKDELNDQLQGIEKTLREVRREKMKAGYEELAKHAKASYPLSGHEDYREMEVRENKLREQGIDEYVQDKLKEWESKPGIIRPNDLQALRENLTKTMHERRTQVQGLRTAALELISKVEMHIPALHALVKQKPRVSDEDIFNKALDLYEFGRLMPTSKSQALLDECAKLEHQLTLFLYHAAIVQQHQHALNHLSSLDKLHKEFQKIGEIKEEAERKKREHNLSKGWDALSGKIFHTLNEATVFNKRFLDDKGVLTNPVLNRKILVAQWRFGIVYKQEQIETIKDLVEKENLCLLRNPGFGKSKAVFPIVIAIMVERHHSPIVLATGELLRIAEQDLDKFSRHVFKQARHIFRFHSSKTLSSAELVEVYQSLDEAQKTEGFTITSIESLAALDNTIVRKSKEISKQYHALVKLAAENGGLQKVIADLNGMGLVAKIIECSKQKHWMQMIRQLLQSKYFVADEVDDIFDINRWINEALETPSDLNKDLLTVIDSTFVSMLEIAKNAEHELLKKLAQSMLHNEQANMTSTQVVEALEFFVNQLYDQKDPLGLSEQDWKKFKTTLDGKKISKEQFVQYIMGKPKATLNMQWDSYPDETVLKAVSTLKHLCTLTLKTVLKEEAGLDYGFNEDGCTAEPLKKGEPIPFTKHGDEYELVAYNYALFASASLSYLVFKDEWRQIQSEITAGIAPQAWTDFYVNAKVQDKAPRTQVLELYNLLQQPDHWKERFLLLKGIMTKRVRMFREQIRNNVQSIILGEDKRICGASGTVNPDALPAELKMDPSCHSRKVSAALDIGLAEMNADADGLNTPVEIFDDTKGHDAEAMFTADAENLYVQAIINQGGVLKGKNSREAVEFLREELAAKNIQRQIVYVDPATRQILLWDPLEKNPEKYDPEKLKENHLFYYGPPEARGVDLPIQFGEISWYTAKTIQEQQRCQSMLRAREFAKGHSLKIRMHKSIQASINFKLGRAVDHAVTYAELFNDIKLRTIEEQAQSNWKAANHRIHALSLGTVKNAVFAPLTIDESLFWNIDANDPLKDVLRILSHLAAETTLFDYFKEEFIKERHPDFKGDFVPFEEVKAIDELHEQFKNEQEKAEKYSDWASMDAVGAVMDNLKKLIPMPGIKLDELTKEHLKKIFVQLQKLPEKVEKAHKNFNKAASKACLRTNIPKSLNENSSAQEQVQQQQQQALGQMAKKQAAKAKAASPEYSKTWSDWRPENPEDLHNFVTSPDFVTPGSEKTACFSANAALGRIAKNPQPDFGLDHSIQISQNQLHLIECRRWMMGHTLDRVAIWQKGSDIIMQAIDQQDFNLGYQPVIAKGKTQQNIHLEVHSLGSQTAVQKNAPSDFLEGCGNSILTVQDEKKQEAFLLKIAQMKLIHGHMFFGKDEAELLVDWLKNLSDAQKNNWKHYLCVIHNESRMKNIRGFENSPLKAVLAD